MIVKLKDFERIHKIIRSVVAGEGANPAHACMYFSVFGSYILTQHYKVDARPKCGLAAFYVGGDNEVILFGQEHNGTLTGDRDAFHCWIEVDGWVIDFMSPSFPKLMAVDFKLPARMFQKPLASMASNINDMKTPGDFYLLSYPETAQRHLSVFTSSLGYSDLAEICSKWFKKCPRKISSKIMIGNGKGHEKVVPLSGPILKGKW